MSHISFTSFFIFILFNILERYNKTKKIYVTHEPLYFYYENNKLTCQKNV